jgi:SMI1-KNR4 cell-wall
MTTYTESAARFVRYGDRDVGIGATEVEITSAEQELRLSIQGSYRDFLRQFGWDGAGAFELYGLGSDVPPHLDLIRITRSEREVMEPSLRTYLLPLMNDGGGNLYCLDIRTTPEPVVVFWDHSRPANQAPDLSGFATHRSMRHVCTSVYPVVA